MHTHPMDTLEQLRGRLQHTKGPIAVVVGASLSATRGKPMQGVPNVDGDPTSGRTRGSTRAVARWRPACARGRPRWCSSRASAWVLARRHNSHTPTAPAPADRSARGRLAGAGRGPVPVFLPLRNLVSLEQGLDAFIERELSGPHAVVPGGFGGRCGGVFALDPRRERHADRLGRGSVRFHASRISGVSGRTSIVHCRCMTARLAMDAD